MNTTFGRFVPDLKLHAIDRSFRSCAHKTEGCRDCYNRKFSAMYPSYLPALERYEDEWPRIGAGMIRAWVSRFQVGSRDRVRLCTVGEPMSDPSDLDRIGSWALHNPGTMFWVPTRAWQAAWASRILDMARTLPNLRVLASLDYSTRDQWARLALEGWSTMFFGDDTSPQAPGAFRCPKTWEHQKGACASCDAGCFNPGRKDVWLKKH